MYNKVIDFFLSQEFKDTEERRKEHLLINLLLALALFSLTYLITGYCTGIIIAVWTNYVLLPGVLIALFTYKFTQSHIISSNIAVFSHTAGISLGVLFSGNLYSAALPWLIISPGVAFLLANRKSGILWTIISLALILVFSVFSILKLDIPNLFPQPLQSYILTMTFLAVTVFVTLIINVYHQTNRTARKALEEEKKKSEDLLRNILPENVATELKETGRNEPKLYQQVTILFSDFVGFTKLSEELSPNELVSQIDECFAEFDQIIELLGIEKIKTIGDAYLAVCGLPEDDPQHAIKIVTAALAFQGYMNERKRSVTTGIQEMRIGIHTGAVIAGIVGRKKFAYDIWGDSVNVAARMEQSGTAGKINISESTYSLIKDQFSCTFRGQVEAKNKGVMNMYFVDKADEKVLIH